MANQPTVGTLTSLRDRQVNDRYWPLADMGAVRPQGGANVRLRSEAEMEATCQIHAR